MTHALQQFLTHHLLERHCPGALVHVEQAGQVLARHAAGELSPGGPAMGFDARFRIASLTKPVVSVAALMLVDEQRLSLDEPVAERLVPLRGLKLPDGSAPKRAPTVRDLMRHTAGFAYPFEVPEDALRARLLQAGFTAAMGELSSERFLEALAQLPLAAEPGTRFRYGYSTDVLGCLIEHIEGKPLGEVLQARLFKPLGMARTSFCIEPDDALAQAFAQDRGWHAQIPTIGQRQAGAAGMDSGGGGLLSTLDDYAAFGRMLADGGLAAGRRYLSTCLLQEMQRNQLPEGVDGPGAYCGPGFGFGLGFAVRSGLGPAAMPCAAGEMVWSGISGTAFFVNPRERWMALLFSANMASRMMARMAFRRACAGVQ